MRRDGARQGAVPALSGVVHAASGQTMNAFGPLTLDFCIIARPRNLTNRTRVHDYAPGWAGETHYCVAKSWRIFSSLSAPV